jgi:hypothetical protein
MTTLKLTGTCAAAILTMGIAIAAGCDTTAPPFGGRLDPAQPYPKVSVAPPIYEFVAFEEPTVTPGEGQTPLHVVTPCRSTQDGATRVQYQYEWFDEVGRPLDASGWKYVIIPARAQVFLESNALTTKAKDWRLTVRPAG